MNGYENLDAFESFDRLVDSLRGLPRERLVVLDMQRVRDMQKAAAILERALSEAGCTASVRCGQCEAAPEMGEITIEGLSIRFQDLRAFAQAARLARNAEVYSGIFEHCSDLPDVVHHVQDHIWTPPAGRGDEFHGVPDHRNQRQKIPVVCNPDPRSILRAWRRGASAGRNFYFLGKHDGGPRLFSGCGCYGWKGKSASDGGILPAVFLYRRIVAAAAKRWHSVAVSGDVPLYYDDFGPGDLQRQAVTEKDVPQEITFVRKIPLS